MSFPRHTKIYQSDEPKGSRTNCSASLGDHRSDESSASYSFVGCSPAEPASASPAATSFSHNPAAVHCSAAKRNLSPFSLSQPKGPLQTYRLLLRNLKVRDNGGTRNQLQGTVFRMPSRIRNGNGIVSSNTAFCQWGRQHRRTALISRTAAGLGLVDSWLWPALSPTQQVADLFALAALREIIRSFQADWKDSSDRPAANCSRFDIRSGRQRGSLAKRTRITVETVSPLTVARRKKCRIVSCRHTFSQLES
jgi:hypothetical protein